MKRFAKAVSAAVCTTLLFGAAACSPGESGEVYEPYDYTVRHQSIDDVLRFYSSDNRLDAFMNEYFERHMRYDEDLRIHTFPVGGGQPVWKEWESMIGSFWDASPANVGDYYATNRWMRDWLALDYMSVQDRQGYISTSTGVTTDDWGQGWSFPSYRHSRRQLRRRVCGRCRRLDGGERHRRLICDGRRRRQPADGRRGGLSGRRKHRAFR